MNQLVFGLLVINLVLAFGLIIKNILTQIQVDKSLKNSNSSSKKPTIGVVIELDRFKKVELKAVFESLTASSLPAKEVLVCLRPSQKQFSQKIEAVAQACGLEILVAKSVKATNRNKVVKHRLTADYVLFLKSYQRLESETLVNLQQIVDDKYLQSLKIAVLPELIENDLGSSLRLAVAVLASAIGQTNDYAVLKKRASLGVDYFRAKTDWVFRPKASVITSNLTQKIVSDGLLIFSGVASLVLAATLVFSTGKLVEVIFWQMAVGWLLALSLLAFVKTDKSSQLQLILTMPLVIFGFFWSWLSAFINNNFRHNTR